MHPQREQAGHFARRTFLKAGSISAGGLLLPQLLQAEDRVRSHEPTAKSCILLYMLGGPAQHETFDMKPEAAVGIRGEFSPIATAVPGLHVCEHLPRLARLAQHYTVIRSVHHDATFHGAGVHYNLTGWEPTPRVGQPMLDRRDPPSIGGVVEYFEGKRTGLPASVQLPMWITQDGPGNEWAGQHAGFLGPTHDPLLMDFKGDRPGNLPRDFVPNQVNQGGRLGERVNLLRAIQAREQIGLTSGQQRWRFFQQGAMDVLNASASWQSFCIEEESPTTREQYGDHHFGRSCLVARRLVESGVRLVTVVWPITQATPHFDTHANHFPAMKDQLLPPMDQGIAALLEDLHSRGLLDETLVACAGEFGRTPQIDSNPKGGGRHHWGPVYSTLLAGGGVRGGSVYGQSDKRGAVPADDPVHVSDWVATIYHALGYGRDTRVVDFNGRPHYIVRGQPVRSVLL